MPRYAALDIGSNSIRMRAAEVLPGAAPRILATEREVTRLGESVFHTGRLSEEAMDLACSVLAKMAQRFRALDVVAVRAVATASVRDARNQAEFLERASAAATVPVEVISGREEARLIQLGVMSQWPDAGDSVLIADIGGGSAEIIWSHLGHMRDAVSKPLGAIRLRELFLRHDPPEDRELAQMSAYVAQRLKSAVDRFGTNHWVRAVATSATAAAVVCAVNGIPRARRDEADHRRASAVNVRRLFRKLAATDLAGRRKVTGIGPRRAEIIVPGTCTLLGILEAFRLPSIHHSTAGVRDGVIADLAERGVGRELSRLNSDERKEVEQMSARYGVMRGHARKVALLADDLFQALQPLHELPARSGRLLEAAAYLHDVGHYISDSSHHKHSYYIVSNSDMPGFTSRERELIANLCRYHRKAAPSQEHLNLKALAPDEKKLLSFLIPLLRLADALDRSHAQRVREMDCAIRNGQVVVEIRSPEDISLEKWAAERESAQFQGVYGRPIVIKAARGT